MSRIKTRESVKDIKVIDKAAVASEREDGADSVEGSGS